MKKISNWLKKNWPLIGLILLFLLINNLNYIVGFIRANHLSGFIYSGLPNINIGDYNVYLSYIEQGWQGRLMMRILYNPASHYVLFSPLWFVIGQFNRLTNISIIISYQLFRVLFSLIFITTLYWWVKKIFSSAKLVWSALAFILFSNGIGLFFLGVLQVYKIYPTNQWVPESITFLNLSQGPLFILSQTLLLLVFALFIKAWQEKKIIYLFWACLSNLFLGLIHPYDLVIIMPTLLIFSAWEILEKKQLKIILYYSALGISSLLAGLYCLWLLKDPAMLQYKEQNILLSKNILEYVFGFGLLTILSLLGIGRVFKQKLYLNPYLKLLTIWGLIGWGLVYLPLDFNRRLSNGWHIPLAILSFIALSYVSTKLVPRWRLIVLGGLITVCIFDTIGYTINSIIVANEKNNQPVFFLGQERMANYEFIKKITSDNDIILSRNNDAALLPGFTGRSVYFGNLILTPNPENKSAQIALLWTSKKNISDWLKNNQITYVFASRDYVPEFEQIKWLAKEPYIEPIIDNDSFILYKVKN